MELLAVIKGLEALKAPNQDVTIFSDSKYVIDSIEKRWVHGWVQKGFAGKKNKDLWLRYLEVSKLHKIKFVWVRGHNGHPENERCDVLAVMAGKQKGLLIDSVFTRIAARRSFRLLMTRSAWSARSVNSPTSRMLARISSIVFGSSDTTFTSASKARAARSTV